jgi:hypothetical protein
MTGRAKTVFATSSARGERRPETALTRRAAFGYLLPAFLSLSTLPQPEGLPMRMADLLSRFPGRGPGALAALLLAALALHAAQPAKSPAPAPAADGNDVLITVQETNTGSLLFDVGVNSDAGLTGSIVLNERNFDLMRPPTGLEDLLNGAAFRGAGQELRIEAVPGTLLQRYSVGFPGR